MSSPGPLISIIVPAYNAAPFLPALCDSILAQTYNNFEALFFDDGSSDHTTKVLREYEKDSRFRVFRSDQNRGVNAATNSLLNLFRGDYWCHPGADDLLLPRFLEQRVALLEANPKAVLAHGPAARLIDEHDREFRDDGPVQPELPQATEGEHALALLLEHNVIATPSIMVRSNATKKVLPHFQTSWRYAQDWYFWLLHVATGGEVLWDRTPLHVYRVHSGSLTNDPRKAAVRRAEIRLVPLVALSRACEYSAIARTLWARWADELYNLWLIRAASLAKDRVLDPAWQRLGSAAYYGNERERSLMLELLKRGPSVASTFMRERQARLQQSFPVAGLAQIDDPVFRQSL